MLLPLGVGLYQERWPYLGTLMLGPTEDAPGTVIVHLNVGYQSRRVVWGLAPTKHSKGTRGATYEYRSMEQLRNVAQRCIRI